MKNSLKQGKCEYKEATGEEKKKRSQLINGKIKKAMRTKIILNP